MEPRSGHDEAIRLTRPADGMGVVAVEIDGSRLAPSDVQAVALKGAAVRLPKPTVERLRASRSALEKAILDGNAYYGINTGFGSLARERISDDELRSLQRNLVRSHAAGVGEPLAESVVRGMMLVLVASLCRGLSGVRPAVVELLVKMLNRRVTPVVPSVGSVGASGDLAPLAHLALVLIGEGSAEVGGRRLAGREALAVAGLEPTALEPKEGLALINGTHLMVSKAALLCADFDRLFSAAVAACAMSIDGCRAPTAFLDERVQEARNQPGTKIAGALLRKLLSGSAIATADGDAWVQAPYSIRCAPSVLGAAWDGATYFKKAVEHELGAVTDNPLVFADAVIAAGNFHGLPVALPLDLLAIVLSHIAGISERRSFLLLDAREPQSGLLAQLSPRPGLCSGLMVSQYTAAACCNELIGLATPASVANIPTSAGIEDYNSFGPRAAAKAERGMDLARTVVAVELLCAAQALEYQRPASPGKGVKKAHALVREVVPPLTEDRILGSDISLIATLIERGAFQELVLTGGPGQP